MKKNYYTDIIVGAGSTGCVIVARLSEDPNRKVLLVEAGPDYPDLDSTPATLRNGLTPDLVTHGWGYSILGNLKPIDAPRGKVVGGSSAINACLALRAEKSDFQDWNKAVGGGWDWDTMLNSYMSIENDLDFGGESHGHQGPVQIKRWTSKEIVPISRAFLEACKEKGFSVASDFNEPSTTGVGILPMNLIKGVRQSSALCFLNPIRKRTNLTILPNTLVERVSFDDTHAKGIIVTSKLGEKEIEGERIILCAGAYDTPAILMRSGIGDERNLRKYGIKMVSNRPSVGKNFIDHPQCYIPVSTIKGIHNAQMPCAQILLKFTSSQSKYINDMQLSVLNWVNLTRFAPEMAADFGNSDIFMIMTQLEYPVSRGSVTLQSASATESPLIELNYSSEEEDMRRLREGIRLGWDVLRTRALLPYVKTVIELNEDTVNDDEKLNQYIRTHDLTSHHPMGTAQMGSKTNPNAVVDNQCRVLGTEQLWVADASIIPVPVRANTNLTCLAIGDKIGKLLAEKN